jgi:hypothetical protein
MSLPIYSTGTVSVAAGGTDVTGAGVMWSGINVKQGDFISIAGLAEVLITEVTDAANLKITPWQGAAQTNAPYIIYQNYVGRVVGVAAAEDVGEMLEKLHVDGLPFIVGADETVPDPSYGDEGQLAFKPSTGEWWTKQGGVWVPSAGLTALGYGGTSATSLLIGTGTKAFTTQGSLAYDGARVRAASAADPNNWMEGVADYFGTSLTMMSDKIGGSGTHADWLFSIAGQPGVDGVDGLGAGDVIGPASAVIDNIATFDAVTGKKIKDGAVKISDLATTNQAVRYDTPQTLTEAQDAQARSNIYAAPFDALAYNGMQINGSMEVSQENGGAVVSANKYPADGWVWAVGTTSGGVTNAQQTLQNPVAGLKNALAITVATAPSGVAAGDWYVLCQRIEGHRVTRLGWGFSSAQPITIGFWTAHHRTGIYSVGVTNSGATRAYMATYTQAAADTWQYNVITIPGCQDGAWLYDNNAGMVLNFSVAMGATYTAPSANSWLTGQYLAAPGQVNGVAATTDIFRITGVVVIPGIEAPSAERSPLIMRPYDQELVTCQRYLPCISTVGAEQLGFGMVNTAAEVRYFIPFTTPTRVAPTGLVVENPANLWVDWPSNSGGANSGGSNYFIFAGTSGGYFGIAVAGAPVGYASNLRSAGPVKLLWKGAQL